MRTPAQKFNKNAKLNAKLSEAEKVLKGWGIEYTKDPATGVITVPGNIDMQSMKLKQLPDLSAVIVEGHFDCQSNQLTSLEGAPRKVGGFFSCYNNNLVSLAGAPQTVGCDFYCDSNQLTSLTGAPQIVGGSFYCHENQLTSIAGAPETVGDAFYCRHNNLEDMYGAPQNVKNYLTPFGDFFSWAEIPDDVKKSPARIAREKEELCKKIKDEIHAGTTRELHTTRIKFIKKPKTT